MWVKGAFGARHLEATRIFIPVSVHRLSLQPQVPRIELSEANSFQIQCDLAKRDPGGIFPSDSTVKNSRNCFWSIFSILSMVETDSLPRGDGKAKRAGTRMIPGAGCFDVRN
jgi:hypothetical protein